MKLSTRSRYGVRLMTRLALNHGKGATLMRDISRIEGISEKYLGQIIIPLRGAGLVSGRRGAGGGYTLSRAPSEITVRDVVEVLEGDISLVPCTGDPSACSRRGACAATEVWQKLAGPWRLDAERLEQVAHERALEDLEPEIGRILRGEQRGRILLNLGDRVRDGALLP